MILTDQLRRENETIRVVLKILDRICEKIDSGEQVPSEDLHEVVELAGALVQRLHQRKEEDVLLSTMEESPVDERGPFAALLADHRAIRKRFQEMKACLAKYHTGDVTARSAFVESARLYGRLLDGHLEMADKDLYGRVDMHLSRKKQGELVEKFVRSEGIGPHRDAQLLRLRRTYLE